MRISSSVAAVAAYISAIHAAPTTSEEPCAAIGAALANKHSPTDLYGNVMLDPDVALACLESVPLDKSGDLALLEGLKTMSNFQSDLAYLKEPTPAYLYPGVDVLGSYDALIAKLRAGGYNSEYQLQLDISDLVTSVHDFHANYVPDILGILNWSRGGHLISVSIDGQSLPDIYSSQDLALLAGRVSKTYTPSPIVTINGTDVQQWVNDFAAHEPWGHDPDTNFNAVMLSIPSLVLEAGIPDKFNYGFTHFPGRQTVLGFANGSTAAWSNYAFTQSDFTGVTDGSTFFETFCSGPQPSGSASGVPSSTAPLQASSRSATVSARVSTGISASSITQIASSSVTTNNRYTALASATPVASIESYPPPFALTEDKSLLAFFPDNLTDVLVIALPTFGPKVGDWAFQNQFRSALATAMAEGKKRLILDLRQNGGGNVNDGFSLFKELFPSKLPYGGTNLPAWPLYAAVGPVGSSYKGSWDDYHKVIGYPQWDYRQNRDASYKPFTSWLDFYGPVSNHGGLFTNIRRFIYSDSNALGDPIYGYGNDTAPQPQTFDAENIVILSDGLCGSTCAVFAELMKSQAGVRTVAIGGRKQYCPMQHVGGSKGSSVQMFTLLGAAVNSTYSLATAKQKEAFDGYIHDGQFVDYLPLAIRAPDDSSRVNFLNNIRQGDESATPLQFVYEAANYRLWNTPQNMVDQALLWSEVYNVRWGNGTSVKGSTGHPSAQTGDATSYIGSPAPACAKTFFGADTTWSYPGAYGSSSPNGTSSTAPSSTPTARLQPSPSAATGGASGLTFGAGMLGLVVFSCGWMF